MSCKVCKELIGYKTKLIISELMDVNTSFPFTPNNFMPIKFCPTCGNRLKETMDLPENKMYKSKIGHWIHHDAYDASECSLCGYSLPDSIYPRLSYCPRCGSDMDLKNEECL